MNLMFWPSDHFRKEKNIADRQNNLLFSLVRSLVYVSLSLSPSSVYLCIHPSISVSQTNSEETNVDLPTPSTKR